MGEDFSYFAIWSSVFLQFVVNWGYCVDGPVFFFFGWSLDCKNVKFGPAWLDPGPRFFKRYWPVVQAEPGLLVATVYYYCLHLAVSRAV